MIDQRLLRGLMHQRMADTVSVDLASSAWDLAQRTRRRRAGTITAAAVAVVTVVGVVAVAGCDESSQPLPPGNSSTAPTATAGLERAGTYGGLPVWWIPTTAEEEGLPVLDGSPLPPTIDLAAAAELPVGTYPVALLEVTYDEATGWVVAVADDGTSYALDTSYLEPATDQDGNDRSVVTHDSLAPDGRHALFVQTGSLAVYDFGDGSWTTIPTAKGAAALASWESSSSIRVPDLKGGGSGSSWALYAPSGDELGTADDVTVFPPPRPRDEGYGPIKVVGTSSARAHFLAGPVPDPVGGDHLFVDSVVADAGGRDGVLVLPAEGGGGRFDQCCPISGWLDPDTVVFESRWVHARLLAWRVGTGELFRVTDIVGWNAGRESYVASFADLSTS